jgi:hypothetical protein
MTRAGYEVWRDAVRPVCSRRGRLRASEVSGGDKEKGVAGWQKRGHTVKGVGVVLGILLPGSAHFLCGDRKAAVRWLAVLFSRAGGDRSDAGAPGIGRILRACVWVSFGLPLIWLMLCQSYRPVPRIGFVGWVKVLVLAFLIGHAVQMTVGQAVCTYRL